MPNHQPHTAKALFFGCIDDRLAKSDQEFINSIEGSAFHPNMAGGGFALLSPEDRAAALKQIVAAYKINRINHIYLQSHTDCGAYRLSGVTFENADQELDQLHHDLEQAARYVHRALSDAGATDGEVKVTLRVVNPAGQVQGQLQTV